MSAPADSSPISTPAAAGAPNTVASATVAMRRQPKENTYVEALGGEFATALALIVDGYGPDRFGQCEAHGCDAVYIDLTKNGSRRYCSPACTARAKTAAYRRRRRS